MSRRLLLGIFLGTLLATAAVSWLLVHFALMQPASRELEAARLQTAVGVAEAMRDGSTLLQLEQELGVDLRMDDGDAEGPPRPPGMAGPPPGGGPPDAGGWTRLVHRDQALWTRKGLGWEVAAYVGPGQGWVVLHQDPLPVGPALFAVLLVLAGLPIALIGYRISSSAVRPVELAERAVERIAEGELSHRLDEGAGSRELKRMSRAVNRMAGRIERLVRGDRRRMACLSHELRTPLTRARLELELARRDADEGVRLGRLERVEGEIAQLEDLVAELLELSRLELGGQDALHREVVDLRGLAELIVDEEEMFDVVVEGEGEASVDARLIRRAIVNLLRNSARHAPDAKRWIRVSSAAIVVGDDGPGIREEDRERLFDLFWRGPDGSQVGHGLGLAIVQQVMELHGGGVQIDSPPGFVATLALSAD